MTLKSGQKAFRAIVTVSILIFDKIVIVIVFYSPKALLGSFFSDPEFRFKIVLENHFIHSFFIFQIMKTSGTNQSLKKNIEMIFVKTILNLKSRSEKNTTKPLGL